jgi:hypothetical protein
MAPWVDREPPPIVRWTEPRSSGDLDLAMTLRGPLAALLTLHATRLQRRPVDLLADLIERVLTDDLVDAVLDE